MFQSSIRRSSSFFKLTLNFTYGRGSHILTGRFINNNYNYDQQQKSLFATSSKRLLLPNKCFNFNISFLSKPKNYYYFQNSYRQYDKKRTSNDEFFSFDSSTIILLLISLGYLSWKSFLLESYLNWFFVLKDRYAA